jgi:transcriptional regulator
MAQKGLSMRKIREVLRLRALGLSQQEIAAVVASANPPFIVISSVPKPRV